MTYETKGLSKTERRLAALELATTLFDYDRETGTITRRRDGAVMDTIAQCGAVLLNTKLRAVSAGQYVWYVLTGIDPNEKGAQVIHLDGDEANNHWENLERRLGSVVDRKSYRNNTTSPYAGVSLNRKTGYYVAKYFDVFDGHKMKCIGSKFATAQEAKVARDEVVKQMVAVAIANGFQTVIENANV